MNLRALGTAFYIACFLLTSYPERRRLKKLAKTDPAESSRQAHLQVKKVFRGLLRIAGIKIEVEGLENIPKEPCLYVGNHNGYYDILVAETVIPSGAGFVSKDSLAKIPGLASWMLLIHCLFLDRQNVREGLKTILTGVDYLKEGYSMFIFPEGTRSKNGQIGEFKGGSLKMAQKANAPIVPVSLWGTADIFENNQGLRVCPGTVKLSFGTPILYSSLSKEEKKSITDMTRNAIQEMLTLQQKC